MRPHLFENKSTSVSKRLREKRGLTNVVGVITGETDTLQQNFEEDLGVESEGSSIEWCGIKAWIDVVSTGYSVRSQQCNQLIRSETSTISKSSNDRVNTILRLGDESQRSRGCGIGSSS